jgi:general stress protein 26
LTPISDELAAFIQSGVSVLVGTRDERCIPEAMRGAGARVEGGGRELTVWFPAANGRRTVENLRATRRIAVCFSAFEKHRSMQLKGEVLDVREGTDADRAFVEQYRTRLAAEWGILGIAPRIVLRLHVWPCFAARFRVERVFVQTPGPGAGAPLGEAR